MSRIWEFALSVKQAIAITVCLALAALMFLVAGFAGGIIVALNNRVPLALLRSGTPAPALAAVPVKPPVPEVKKLPAAAESPVPAIAGSSERETPVVAAVAPESAAASGSGDKAAVPVVAAAAKPTPLPIRIAVQVGSFSAENNARSVLERLKRFGYPATSFAMTDARSRTWHVVQVGPYADYDDASRIAMELSGKYRIEPRLVPQTEF